jgi:hypothetical protein
LLRRKRKQFLGVTARPLLEDKMKRLSAELEGFTPQGRNKAEREAFGQPPLEVEGNRGAESTFFKVRVVRTQNRNSKVDLIP